MTHASFGPAGTRANISTLRRSDGLVLPIHKELVTLISILLDLTEALGVDVRPGETWGYAYRVIAGTNTLSNHSWGTAVDINAPANPYASATWHEANGNRTVRGKRLKTEFTDEIVKLWEGHGFRWGGWYRTKPDPMHFEFMGSVDDARRYARNLSAFLGASAPKPVPVVKPAPVVPAPAPRPGPRALREGDRGEDVKGWQTLVGVTPDGSFGPKTTAATKEFQRKVGLGTDGIVGPATHAKMGELLAFLAVQKPVRPTLRRGSQGEHVRYLQQRLNAHRAPVRVDGDFGPATVRAVQQFQRAKGLPTTGIVASRTWAALG
jgi:peptidoglycan hydrolase-like protein with peptidoglycan-binding domain